MVIETVVSKFTVPNGINKDKLIDKYKRVLVYNGDVYVITGDNNIDNIIILKTAYRYDNINTVSKFWYAVVNNNEGYLTTKEEMLVKFARSRLCRW